MKMRLFVAVCILAAGAGSPLSAATLGLHTPVEYAFDAAVPKVVQRELDIPRFYQDNLLGRLGQRKIFEAVHEVYSHKTKPVDFYVKVQITRIDLGEEPVRLLNTFGTTRAGMETVTNIYDRDGQLLDTLHNRRRVAVDGKTEDVLQYLCREMIQDLTRFLQVLKEHPARNTRDFTARGRRQMDLRDFEGAVINFTRAIQEEPENPASYRFRGRARQFMGDVEGSREDMNLGRRVQREGPGAVTGGQAGETQKVHLEREKTRELGTRTFRSLREGPGGEALNREARQAIARRKLLDVAEQLLAEELISLSDFGELHDYLAKWK